MNFVVGVLLFIGFVIVVSLDASGKINVLHPVVLVPLLFVQVNLVLILGVNWGRLGSFGYFVWIPVGLFCIYGWVRFHIVPVLAKGKVSLRLLVMIGGRFITRYAVGMFTVELVFLIWYMPRYVSVLSPGLWVGALIYTVLALLLMFGNGLLRIFFTSKRLSVGRRVVMVLTMWIPAVNFVVFLYACRLVQEEYDFALYKQDLSSVRAHSDLCETKYPLVMVHGIFFRDLKYFNYWGRIPKELTRYGARIYYGNQEAVGTVAYNAEDIRKKILEVVESTGCEKVNIVAHSKGGLDSRYAISRLGMDQYVASLTTMNTPHRGCLFVDKAMKLPKSFIMWVGSLFNRTFRKFGDKNPDFYNAVMQFTTEYSRNFNNEVLNSDEVYYQSYTTKMKSLFSDSILGIPYFFIRLLEGDNDGLVSETSAVWGQFQGTVSSTKRRGISHGDIIDLKREDYKGFDVIEFYVQLVKDLKEKGY